MRLSVIKHKNDGTDFYNPGVFHENEDLIIFPFKEFDKFYNETVQNINVVKNMIKDSLKSGTANNTPSQLKYVEDWINLISEDMDLLIKFDTQTSLNSFNKSRARKIKQRTGVNKIHKVQIQCLMGL